MSYISPQLISRIYQALGQNRGADAVMLLRQQRFECRPLDDGQLLDEIVRLADADMSVGDSLRAAEHYELGLALYESCFQQRHCSALRCVAGLLALSEDEYDSRRCISLIDQAQAITSAVRDALCKPKAVAV
jgi:hypothetical protein